MKTIVHIKDGKIQNPKIVAKAFKLADGRYELKIDKATKRSLQQNAYFHAILPEILEAFRDRGYDEIKTTEDVKLILKYRFLKHIIVNEETGEVMEYIKETHNLNKEEMALFIDEVLKFCSEKLDLVIYSPNEQSAFNY